MILSIIEFILPFTLFLALSYYFITNMQWYSYRIERVLFKHHKIKWHISYFVIPIIIYEVLKIYSIPFILLYFILLFRWSSRQDKKLVFTNRVKRYFGFSIVAYASITTLCYFIGVDQFNILSSIIVSSFFSIYYERYLFEGYYNSAKQKLQTMPRLKIVAVTASYGKTSIKNFIADTLSKNIKVYKTPKSVNTLAGIVQDINNNLDYNIDVYIVEAGARAEGDIEEISKLLEHQYAVVGTIGPAHIEYFKSMDVIHKTKLEILNSTSLKRAFIIDTLKKDPNIPYNLQTTYFPLNVKNITSSLDGLSFELLIKNKYYKFETSILGKFNIINIVAAINVAREFNTNISDIQENVKSMKSVEHRLNKIVAGEKIIIDDSFNGNFDGMSEAINIVSTHKGRKVIVTPGLVESNDILNISLSKLIDQVFDLVIITGELNYKILSSNIVSAQKIVLKEKSLLEQILASHTKKGDIILFANDAPTYI